jgi:hypothetical protein
MRRLLLLTTMAAACAGSGDIRRWDGLDSAMPSAEHVVARTQEEWLALWAKVERPAPEADLTRHFAVGVFLGDKRAGDYKFAWRYATSGGRKRVEVFYAVYRAESDRFQRRRPYAVWLFPLSIAEPGAEIVVSDETPGGAHLL